MDELKKKGNEAYVEKDYATAIQFYTEAAETDEGKTSDVILVNRAAAHIALKDYASAQSDCKTALELNPKNVKAHLRMGKACWMLCELEEAEAYYSHALVLEPTNTDAKRDVKEVASDRKHYESAVACMENFDYNAAKNHINIVMGHTGGSRALTVMKARCNIHTFPEIASRDLRNILTSNPNDSEALALRGKALLYAGQSNIQMAIQHFKQALSVDPDCTEAAKLFKSVRKFEKLKEEANELFKTGKHEEAEEKYSEALAVDPQNKRLNSVLYSNRAAAKMAQKKYDEAVADCTKAIDCDGTFVKAYVRRSKIYEELEQYEKAQADLETASEMDTKLEDSVRALKKRIKMAKRKNFYKILGVSRDADDREIKKAYRAAAMEWHPDKWHTASDEEKETAEAKFKEIGEAFAILSDPQKRRKYDMGVIDGESDHQVEEDPFGGFGGFQRGGFRSSPFGFSSSYGGGGQPFGF
ncbi:DnaJ-like protein subfamily C member 7-like protein [Diplonema papillatum]|nr:DnaJ-like protein subfamily C member 7-like protein [Diplonema papillatum]